MQLQAIIVTNDATRRSIADLAVQMSCSDQSLKTMMEICVRCLLKDAAERPSVEDVLWNLQFAAQVQDNGGEIPRAVKDLQALLPNPHTFVLPSISNDFQVFLLIKFVFRLFNVFVAVI